MQADRHPTEIANLAEVEEAVSSCVEQGRSLTLNLVLSLHGILFRGVLGTPNHPTHPGRRRPPEVKIGVSGGDRMSSYIPESWRLESALTELLEEVREERGPGDYLSRAASFHYRFVKMHPFCDGNGRLARAISLLLVARGMPSVLRSRRPVNRILREHRDDYVEVLKYCDGMYADMMQDPRTSRLDTDEARRLESCEGPFTLFYARAVIRSVVENTRVIEMELRKIGVDIEPAEEPPESQLDLRFESTRALFPWNEEAKSAALASLSGERRMRG